MDRAIEIGLYLGSIKLASRPPVFGIFSKKKVLLIQKLKEKQKLKQR